MSHELTAYSPCHEGHHPHTAASRPRWLLIKGLARQCRHWHDFPHRLATTAGADVQCLDLPGAGSERHRRCPNSVAEIVDDLRARWVRPTPHNHPDFILGLSLGGMVAMEWVRRFPDDFAGCVLINTSGKGVGNRLERLRPAAVWTFARLLITRRLEQRERLILKLCTSGAPVLMDRYLSERVEIGRRSPVKFKTFLSQIYAAACYRAPRTLRVPVLVLAGEQDRLTHPECCRRLARRLGAELRTHPHGGHELTLDDADWVAEQAATWARRTVLAAVGLSAKHAT